MEVEDVRVKLCQHYITKLDLETKAFIQDIQKCEGPLEELDGLNQRVSEKIRELKLKLEELEKLAKEQDKETTKIAILKDVDKSRTQLTSTQALLRKANLVCQLTIQKKEKEQLLDGGSELRQRRPNTKEAMANTATSITENLMSLSRLMAAQVQQSEQTMSTLVSSSKTVGESHEELKSMTGHIQSSHKLLVKYGRRECTDKLLIVLALVFFFASVLYVIKKRLFDASS